METISVSGKEYVKAKIIARELGYTTDYVGQLCRAEKIDAKLVGRSWYVDPDSLRSHKGTRYRSTKETSKREMREQLRKELASAQVEKAPHFYGYRAATKKAPVIQYLSDDAELLPSTVKKEQESAAIELPVELADAEKVEVAQKTEQHYHFTAPKREETVFYGTLEVTDYQTEVPVRGQKEQAKPVEVQRSTLYRDPVVKHTEIENPLQKVAIQNKLGTATQTPPLVKQTDIKKKGVSLPVAVDDEEVPLTIGFRVFTTSIVITGFLVAAFLLGLESQVSVRSGEVTIMYAFKIDNLAALIYLAK